MPLPLTVSCFSKIQTGFAFLVPAHPGSPGQRAVKCVCVCVCVRRLLVQVNRYGHLSRAVPSDCSDRCGPANVTRHRFPSSSLGGPESRDRLRDVIESVAPPGELAHCLVLLDCLLLMASDDGLPLFL